MPTVPYVHQDDDDDDDDDGQPQHDPSSTLVVWCETSGSRAIVLIVCLPQHPHMLVLMVWLTVSGLIVRVEVGHQPVTNDM